MGKREQIIATKRDAGLEVTCESSTLLFRCCAQVGQTRSKRWLLWRGKSSAQSRW